MSTFIQANHIFSHKKLSQPTEIPRKPLPLHSTNVL